MSITHQSLWQKCLQLIRKQIGDQLFSTWFSDVKSVSFDGTTLIIQVPSHYVRQLYEDRFYEPLGKALTQVYGSDVELFYQIGIVQDDASATVRLPGSAPANVQKRPQQSQRQSAEAPRREDISGLKEDYIFENYCVGESNCLPFTIAKSIADHPDSNDFNPFVVYGNVGVGKTHLIQAIGHRLLEQSSRSRVVYVPMRNFQNQYSIATMQGKVPDFINFYQNIDVLLIDDLQELSGKKGTIEALYPIFNHLHQGGKKLIFTCDRPPVALEGIIDRLLDRFKWGSTEELPDPDLELRKKILRVKAAAGGLDLGEDVIDVIASNVVGSVRELEGVVAGLISRAIFLSVPITPILAAEVVKKTVKPRSKTINFDMIIEQTAEAFDISPDVIFSRSRVRDIADSRQVIMYLASKYLDLSLTAIGTKLNRLHSTVLHGIKAVKDRLPFEPQLAERIQSIEKELNK